MRRFDLPPAVLALIRRGTVMPAPPLALARAAGRTGPATPDREACTALVAWLGELNHALEIPSLGRCRGVTRAQFDACVGKMAADALASGSPAHNPRVSSASEIVELYRGVW